MIGIFIKSTVKKGISDVFLLTKKGVVDGLNTCARNIQKDSRKILKRKIRQKHKEHPWLKPATGNLHDAILHALESQTAVVMGKDVSSYVYIDVQKLQADGRNPRGINYAKFVEYPRQSFEGYYFMNEAYENIRKSYIDIIKERIVRKLSERFNIG